MHKDQERSQNKVVPDILDRVFEDTPEAVRDCTVLGRLLSQGPDPLFLMETCPEEFSALCTSLGLDVEEGREAIEAAHWQGPGILLEGEGLPVDLSCFSDVPLTWRKESLWLVLASMSDCTEGGYTKDVSLLERIQRATKAAIYFSRFMRGGRGLWSVMIRALGTLKEFESSTEFTVDPRFGIKLGTKDHSFYIGYKRGYKVVAVQTDKVVFYGTIPETSLEEQGIVVDKKISPQFGMIFC